MAENHPVTKVQAVFLFFEAKEAVEVIEASDVTMPVEVIEASEVFRTTQTLKINNIPYSREQKHVSISDTPMLLIEINSIVTWDVKNKSCPIS